MTRSVTAGRPLDIARSALALGWAMLCVGLRRLVRGPGVPGWSFEFEAGNAFWRGQFRRALRGDIARGRRLFDSLQLYATGPSAVTRTPAAGGEWIDPAAPASDTVVLYCHGGGYAFHSAVTREFGALLAGVLGVRVFALDYRLTPEHPHPAQRDDALAAYRRLLGAGVAPRRIVLLGDSAGGHLVLMLLVALREAGLPQPALAIGLSPWTDVGERGASLHGNDRYDLVEGWMALRFGRWLAGGSGCTREQLSPICRHYAGLAPLYLQGGGREVLIDMIRDFAHVAGAQGAEVMLDVWPDMTHEFHLWGTTLPESDEALARIGAAIAHYTGDGPHRHFPSCSRTEVHGRALRAWLAGTS